VLAAVTLSIGLTINFFGMRQFGGFDHSVLVDTPWRMIHHQTVCRDFPNTFPIGFVLGAYYANALFGASWHSNILWTALYAMALFGWTYWILRKLSVGFFRP
jgi:hypothetical protein